MNRRRTDENQKKAANWPPFEHYLQGTSEENLRYAGGYLFLAEDKRSKAQSQAVRGEKETQSTTQSLLVCAESSYSSIPVCSTGTK
jgi:hypothetical protein